MQNEESVTLEKILEVARAEFLEKGFRGASLREVVKKAGVTTGAFYGYFKSKEELFDALVKKHDEIYAVLGNCDEPEFIEELEDAGINAERVLNYTGGIAIVGSGGGSKFT
ncbi:MAG: TetR family transcriptional regulator, partial [Treponema sp.]|nr:TetR family transcriptional regulator [Treponema sp.]